ncbi:hypothetical protein [Cohnella candidum]|uniref:Uncharacterized protein n=1 Tax=Cohnella candidum TaxID=2674991 RepID=A0A3G3JXJ8_9BACL|nr:hypothetical protein [Cohnella candidum]AYQ72983.1 hypothetical protein EAV92_10660 [Cohnella candidum]
MELSGQRACVVFNRLSVNNIENSSGIFIGVNHAIGWSTSSKTNYGFGHLSDAAVTNVINYLNDSDFVDANMQDVRNVSLTETPNVLQQSAVDFHSIHANALNNGSAIDLGDNKQLGWRNSHKVNYAQGKNLGSNQLTQFANFTMDNDVIDAPMRTEGSIADTSGWVKNIRITQDTEEP